jgi:transcription antitermination factor NusG
VLHRKGIGKDRLRDCWNERRLGIDDLGRSADALQCISGPPSAVEITQPGDRVRVLVGPFADFAGVVRAVDADLQKLNVGVEVLRHETPVLLDFTQAAKLEPDAE